LEEPSTEELPDEKTPPKQLLQTLRWSFGEWGLWNTKIVTNRPNMKDEDEKINQNAAG
jgi:hypothetical protein